jgi:hypothetical protein
MITNLLITLLTLCRSQRQTFWKYNFIQHRSMAEKHLTDSGLLPPCPPELIVSAHISKVEEQWMGVDSEKTKEYRELNEHFGVRNSDDSIFQLQVEVEHRDTFFSLGFECFSILKLLSTISYETSQTDDNRAVL